MWIVGLTGGIGSGKSTVADFFAQLGACIVDADIAARTVVNPHTPGWKALVEAFSSDILNPDETLNRSALRTIIFRDSTARAQVESILHPLIQKEIAHQITLCKGPYCVLVIPLLIEKGSKYPINRLAVVDCPETIQIKRTMQRDSLSAPDVQAILNTQASRADRLQKADDIIDTNLPVETLFENIQHLHQRYCAFAHS